MQPPVLVLSNLSTINQLVLAKNCHRIKFTLFFKYRATKLPYLDQLLNCIVANHTVRIKTF